MGSRVLLCAVTLVSFTWLTAASPTAAVPASHPKSMASGKALFMNHCASCHGSDARGAGPAAIALKVQPPDLTALAKANQGKFPYEKVRKAIAGENVPAAHGSREMPTWGAMFLAMNGVNQKDAEQRITDLTDYIKSLQKK
jgi:mono/diheme cytochrome c family protein